MEIAMINKQSSSIFPLNTKTKIYIGLSVGGCLFGIYALKKYKAYAEKRKQEQALDMLTKPKENEPVTISSEEATVVAQKLLAAMEGMGTDTKTIMSLLIETPRTDGDLKMIIKAFGLKPYGTYGSPMWGKGTYCDLSAWLRNEMSGSDLQKLQVRWARTGLPF